MKFAQSRPQVMDRVGLCPQAVGTQSWSSLPLSCVALCVAVHHNRCDRLNPAVLLMDFKLASLPLALQSLSALRDSAASSTGNSPGQARVPFLSIPFRAVNSVGGGQILTHGASEANSEEALQHPAEGLYLPLSDTEGPL